MKPETIKRLLDCYLEERSGYDVVDGPRVYNAPNVECQAKGDLSSHALYSPAQLLAESQLYTDSIAEINAPYNERAKYRLIAKKLADIAQHYETERSLSFQDKTVMAQLKNEELDEEERKVLNDIISTGSFASVKSIAKHLTNHLTSRTFKAALCFLCTPATSYTEELSLVLELYHATLPESRRDSINDVVSDYLRDKPEPDNL